MTWLYTSSVIETLECPSISETIFGCTPCVSSRVAQGVPEVVEPYVRQPGTLQERLEVAGHEVGVVGLAADGVREDEAAILPGAVRPRSLCALNLPVPCERNHGGVGEVHAP